MARRPPRATLLIPDSGPLFSLAACRQLDLLLNFECVVTDVVWRETAARAASPKASMEARAIATFLAAHPEVTVRETQLGRLTAEAAGVRNLGELSIHSLLIELRDLDDRFEAVVLFEDQWFTHHRAHLPRGVTLIGTLAFLIGAEDLGLLTSSEQAIAEIRKSRTI